MIIVLSAVIGGIILTMAAIVIMILCRRSSSLSLKNLNNREGGIGEKQRNQKRANGTNRTNGTNSTNKNGSHLKPGKNVRDSSETLEGESPFLRSNGNGFDLGSNQPLISSAEGHLPLNEPEDRGLNVENWTNGEESNRMDNQQIDRMNSRYNEFSENQVR